MLAGSLLMLGATSTLLAKAWILPIEAIEDSQYLRAAAFKLRYPGIDVSGYTLDTEGWYVRYSHEKLTYYFGPMEGAKQAEQAKALLDTIRENVIAQRPSLASSRIELIHHTFDPVE